MSMIRIVTLAVIVGLSGPACSAGVARRQPLQTVNSVDLQKYAGTWYEIARYPNRFQRDCAGDVTALYEVKSDGSVRVTNSCSKADGSTKSARASAKVVVAFDAPVPASAGGARVSLRSSAT